LSNKQQIRDSLERELAKADELIVREDAALGGFDARFQAVETEAETAKEHADEAGRVLEEARGKLAIIEERQREERNQRTELQVYICHGFLQNMNATVAFLTSNRSNNARSGSISRKWKVESPRESGTSLPKPSA
jgi:chromosome segregation ATPase